jgi:Glutathione S-transferase, N-terminal domain
VAGVEAEEDATTVRLHRCRFEWLKSGPCWRVEKALVEMGVSYEVVPGPTRVSRRSELLAHTGQRLYPALELEDGTWYRAESRDMARAIRDGKLGLGSRECSAGS